MGRTKKVVNESVEAVPAEVTPVVVEAEPAVVPAEAVVVEPKAEKVKEECVLLAHKGKFDLFRLSATKFEIKDNLDRLISKEVTLEAAEKLLVGLCR